MITHQHFVTNMSTRLVYYKHLGDKVLQRLSDEQLNWQPATDENSIAVIAFHMIGNMRSRFTNFLTEDGEKIWRNRDAEFVPTNTAKAELLDAWDAGWMLVLKTLHELEEGQLMQTITIRGEQLMVFDAFLRQLAHYGYHVGQMVLLAKIQKKEEWESLSIPKKK